MHPILLKTGWFLNATEKIHPQRMPALQFATLHWLTFNKKNVFSIQCYHPNQAGHQTAWPGSHATFMLQACILMVCIFFKWSVLNFNKNLSFLRNSMHEHIVFLHKSCASPTNKHICKMTRGIKIDMIVANICIPPCSGGQQIVCFFTDCRNKAWSEPQPLTCLYR